MAAFTFHLEVLILLTTVGIGFSSPSNLRAEFRRENPSLVDSMNPTTSAVSLTENADYPYDLPNVPEALTANSQVPEVYSLNIWSSIRYRYATTLVTSRVVNRESISAEVVFQFFLPKNAFISSFLMEVKGKTYKAYVKEIEEAKNEYKAAVQRGQTAAHIAIIARDSNLFAVSVNLEPHSKVNFNLTYEELLMRRRGLYDHTLHLVTCNQVIQDMKVEVYINETQKITVIKVPEPTISNEIIDAITGGFVKVSKYSSKSALITYAPSIEQQKELLQHAKANPLQVNVNEESGSQRLRVQYDVDHPSTTGEILLNDGYFVHFFAPSENIFDNSTKPNKHVIFVLDTSGSMYSRKLEQLKEAMNVILDSLNQIDFFSIIEFSYSAKQWSYSHKELDSGQKAYLATPLNIAEAKSKVSSMEAKGGTNIDAALKLALNIAGDGIGNKNFHEGTNNGPMTMTNEGRAEKAQPIIFFLTDGEPTEGDTNLSRILQNTREQNDKIKAPIFSLAFGDDTDFKFLTKLSLQNYAFARKIYSSADANIQLESFFQEISSPLMNNVTFSYISPKVDQSSLTKSSFHTYFNGTEIIIVGRTNDKTLSPEDLGGAVSSSFSHVPIYIYTPKMNKTLMDISPTNTGESRGNPHTKVIEELETFAIKFWPSHSFGKDVNELKVGSLERVWAFLTIRQLLDKELASEEENPQKLSRTKELQEKEEISGDKKRALQLALKYGFVTPLTSLVVVKPPENGNSNNSIGANTELAYDDFQKQYSQSNIVTYSRNGGFSTAYGASHTYLPAKTKIAKLFFIILLFKL